MAKISVAKIKAAIGLIAAENRGALRKLTQNTANAILKTPGKKSKEQNATAQASPLSAAPFPKKRIDIKSKDVFSPVNELKTPTQSPTKFVEIASENTEGIQEPVMEVRERL